MLTRLMAIGLVFVTAQVVRGQDTQSLTADELMKQADQAREKGDFVAAAKLYETFFADYAKAQEPQVVEVIRRRRHPLAMCYVRTKDFASALPAIEAALAATPPLDAKDIQELTFWRGVSQFEEKDYQAAITSLQEFLRLFPPGSERNPNYYNQFPAIRNIPEAELLIGTAILLEEHPGEAAKFFADIKKGMSPVNHGRATVMELYSLLQSNQFDNALQLVREEFPTIGDMLQIVGFQTLTLELGDRLLEEGRLRDAIVCLQRVWSSDRLLKHQRARLTDLESRLAAAELNPDPYQKLLLGQMVAKVKREVENFSKITTFDSALRLRLATAYLLMKRYRESALIIEAMLEEMPPDSVVESASVNLVQSWSAIECWSKAAETGRLFAEVFPKSPSLPLVLYMQGIAEQRGLDHPSAVATFDTLATQHPDSDYAPRAMFMKGFTHLLAEQYPDAIAAFDDFLKIHPKHELADGATYWRAMGFSMDKQYSAAREAMENYLSSYKDGQFRSAAFFRKAYCAQQLEDYNTSIRELGEYLRKYPGGAETAEARVLLGDALMNEGRMEEGIAAFDGISPEETRFHEEGVFKVAKALKLMEEYPEMQRRMQAFAESFPRSPRVAEAIFNIGWILRQEGDLEKARAVYWKAISDDGNDPEIRSVDDLLPALGKLYKGPEEQARFLGKLRDLQRQAVAKGETTLAMRALWAQGHVLRKSDPARAQALFLEAALFSNVQTTNPLLLADFAEALMASGDEARGEALWRDLVKWNPRAPQKDRALAALAFIERDRGDTSAAMELFDRFARQCEGSLLLGRMMLARAALQIDRGEMAAGRASLEALLANPYSTGPQKAEALFRIGESHMAEGHPELAVPYFQRIYVMHGRWRDWVARAYFQSGEAFEKLNDTLSARRTYQELTSIEDLADRPEVADARARLKALGGPLPPETPPAG